MKIGFGHTPASVVASIAAVLLPAAAAARQPPDEARTIDIYAAASDFDGREVTIAVDGWNTTAAEENPAA